MKSLLPSAVGSRAHEPWSVSFERERIDAAASAAAAGASSSQERAHARQRGAELELERLHVEELARLLGQAAQLRLACAERGPRAQAAAARLQTELAAWRAALDDELRAARLDGARYSQALRELFSACELAAEHWPAARVLLRAAASLHPSARRRAALARLARSEGDGLAARAEYRAALACAPAPGLRRELELELFELEPLALPALAQP